MVRHQCRNAQRIRCSNAVQARDSIVHGDNQMRLTRGRQRDNFRGQPIAVFKAVGDEIINVSRTQRAQCSYRQRGTGGTIGVKITNNQQTLTARQGVCQQVSCSRGTL